MFIVHGNTALRLTEMEVDLSGPKAGGLDRVLVQDLPNQDLGYEGSHLQRHDGRYYLFTCHFARGHRKTEDCFIADSLDGEFRGRCILDDDLGYHDQGVAQGGMVDTPDGQWYAFMLGPRGIGQDTRAHADAFRYGRHARIGREWASSGIRRKRAFCRTAPSLCAAQRR